MNAALAEIVPPDGSYVNLRSLAERFSLILASQSPRRQTLLRELGLRFEIEVAAVDETFSGSEDPFTVAQRLAAGKAKKVSGRFPDAVVIGCDTIVVLEGRIMDKPIDPADAFRILNLLSGRTHTVATAVSLASAGVVHIQGLETTEVTFHTVSPEQIQQYVATGEPLDKAGAYGIQGMGGFLVDSLKGRLDTVVGLPRTLLDSLAGGFLVHKS